MCEIKVFMAVKIHIMVWVMTPCSDVVGYQCFWGLCCLHITVWCQTPGDHECFHYLVEETRLCYGPLWENFKIDFVQVALLKVKTSKTYSFIWTWNRSSVISCIFTGVWNLTVGMDWGEMKNQSSLMGKPCAQTLSSRYFSVDLIDCIWKADSHSSGQEISCFLWTPVIHYCVHRILPLDPVLS
jgi:hypothetical protein